MVECFQKQYKRKGFRFNISIPLLRAHVITCLAFLRVHVQTCLACLSAHVLTYLACLSAHVPTYLACLRAHVPTCLACLHAYDPMCLAWYVLTCQRTLTPLCADVPTCLECLRASHVNMTCVLTRVKVACELICSHTNMPWVPCLTLLAWPRDHRLACLACLVSSFDAAFFQFNCHCCWSCSYCWWGSTISLMLFLSNVNSYIIKVY